VRRRRQPPALTYALPSTRTASVVLVVMCVTHDKDAHGWEGVEVGDVGNVTGAAGSTEVRHGQQSSAISRVGELRAAAACGRLVAHSHLHPLALPRAWHWYNCIDDDV
jgi:hypothetical protein